ncbi:HAP5 [Sanghuangporus sanghuang]
MPHEPQTQPFVQPGDLLPEFLRSFWQRQIDAAEQETPDFRHPPLPLARIKKVMKSDPEVKMIAADARAFIVADANKRRTLSRSDIAKALSKSDQFDFLIDIVPREEGFPGVKRPSQTQTQVQAPGTSAGSTTAAASAPVSAGVTGIGKQAVQSPVIKRDEDHERYMEILSLAGAGRGGQ